MSLVPEGFLPFGSLELALLYGLLAAAAAADVAWRRVPNALVVVLAAAGLAARLDAGGWRAALLGAGGVALVLLLLFPVWSRRALGGGDVKLAAACAAWLTLGDLPVFALATALAGGLVAAAALVLSRGALARSEVPVQAAPAKGRPVRVPYSVAIAAGALVALHWRLR
ncbi:MAG TPA: A24 family peptidase [Anaeromyxobacteraceae bacterium]|nr:A24 family peptidase [Anaeromyxobacteraceae bacterium]